MAKQQNLSQPLSSPSLSSFPTTYSAETQKVGDNTNSAVDGLGDGDLNAIW